MLLSSIGPHSTHTRARVCCVFFAFCPRERCCCETAASTGSCVLQCRPSLVPLYPPRTRARSRTGSTLPSIMTVAVAVCVVCVCVVVERCARVHVFSPHSGSHILSQSLFRVQLPLSLHPAASSPLLCLLRWQMRFVLGPLVVSSSSDVFVRAVSRV